MAHPTTRASQRSRRARSASVVVAIVILSALVGSCSGGEPATDATADDRGMFASASGIRICGATTGGIAAAATDLDQAASDADTDRIDSLAATLESQGMQLSSTSRSGAETLAEHTSSDAAKAVQEQGIDLFNRCAMLGDDAVALAALATAASPDAFTEVSSSAQEVAAQAQTVGTDVEEYADGLPKP